MMHKDRLIPVTHQAVYSQSDLLTVVLANQFRLAAQDIRTLMSSENAAILE